MTMYPMIITQTRKVDCIVQAGVRYCENNPANPKEVGIVGMIGIIWLVILVVIFRKAIENDGLYWLLLLGYVLLPFAILALL